MNSLSVAESSTSLIFFINQGTRLEEASLLYKELLWLDFQISHYNTHMGTEVAQGTRIISCVLLAQNLNLSTAWLRNTDNYSPVTPFTSGFQTELNHRLAHWTLFPVDLGPVEWPSDPANTWVTLLPQIKKSMMIWCGILSYMFPTCFYVQGQRDRWVRHKSCMLLTEIHPGSTGFISGCLQIWLGGLAIPQSDRMCP